MKLSKYVWVSGLIAFLLLGTSYADLKDDIVKLVGDNATSYIHPLTNSMGVAMNSGWYNSSKSYKFMTAPIGLQVYVGVPISMINDDLRTYNFDGKVQTANLGLTPAVITALGLPNTLSIKKDKVPTLVGDETGVNVTMEELLLANGISQTTIDNAVTTFPGLFNKNQVVFALPGGIPKAADLSFMPYTLPSLGVNVGLPFKAQVGLRMWPKTNVPNLGSISQFGMKAQYEFTQWVPVFAKLPLLHSSIYYAFNNVNLFDLLKLNNWTTMVNVSGDFKFLMGLGVYGGIGIQGSTMKLDYTVPASVIGLGGTKVSLSDKGDNSTVAQVGARFSVALFDIMADATFGKTTSYYLGVGLGMNGL